MNPRTPSILIVKLSAIGDVVHTLPALNALRRHWPGAHIAWLVEEAAAELLIGHPALNRVLVSQRKAWLSGLTSRRWPLYLRQILSFVRQLRDTRYDMILDFQAALKGTTLIVLARGRRKIGFGPGMAHQEHSYLVLNETIPMVSMEVHALTRGLQMLEALGVPHEKVEYNLPIDHGARRKADQLLGQLHDHGKGRPIAINPMAQWPTKLWPAERFADLADRLIEQYKVPVCFTGSPSDQPVIDGIVRKMRHPACNLAGRTTLIELAALYCHMACLVTTDTGPMHIAAAVDTPVVAIFGPTAEWRTGPYGQGHRVVASHQACRPCFKRACDNFRCMPAVSVETVLQHIDVLLKEGRSR